MKDRERKREVERERVRERERVIDWTDISAFYLSMLWARRG